MRQTHGGQISKKSYFFLDNKENILITEEKVTLLARKINLSILFLIISERKSLRYFCYEAATAAFVQKVAEAKENPKGERIVMTLYEYLDRQIPDYYNTMYLDGYRPDQILHAARRKILQEHEAREAAKRAEAEASVIPEVKITSEVKLR